MFARHPKYARPETVQQEERENRTVQSEADRCNINKIITRYRKTGVIDHTNNLPTQYGVAVGDDFKTIMDKTRKVQQSFESMPVEVRQRFNNDAAQFMDYVSTTPQSEIEKDEMFYEQKVMKPERTPKEETTEEKTANQETAP